MLKRLPVSENRSIIILAVTGAEITSTIFYQVRIGDLTVVSTYRICNVGKDPRSLSFKTLSASAGNLIAVYDETNPERIVVLHDFSEGKSSPRGAPEENDAAITRKVEGLLKKLQQEYANSNLILNGEAWGIKVVDESLGQSHAPFIAHQRNSPSLSSGASPLPTKYRLLTY